MSELRFYCPVTGRQIDPGIEVAETIQAGSVHFEALNVRCPHCSEHHEIKIENEALTTAA